MAFKSCTTCLCVLRRQHRSAKQISAKFSRAISTSPSFSAEHPKHNATTTTSIPPVTPHREASSSGARTLPANLKAATELRRVAGRTTETYTAYGVTEKLFKECARHADYTIPQASDPSAEMPKTNDGEDLGVGSTCWHTELGLKPTFSTWSQVTMLHMYMLAARFRCFPAEQSPAWQQHLLDHFFYDAENRMTIEHNMHARGTRNRYLKDLFIQWRGLLAAYDEGIVKGDAVLAAAVWRNVFKADEEVDLRKVASIVGYMRSSLKRLDSIPDEVVGAGNIVFEDPGAQLVLVNHRSKMMDVSFQDDGAAKSLPVR